jgi:hypothetical protein
MPETWPQRRPQVEEAVSAGDTWAGCR